MALNNRKMMFSCQPDKGLILSPLSQIFPPPPPPPPPLSPSSQEDLSLFVPTLICILGSVILFLVLIFFLYLYVSKSPRNSAATVPPRNTNRSRDEEEAEEEEGRDFSGDHHVWRITTVGLQRSVINSITVVGFKKGEGIIEGTECSVCLNEFEEDESLRLLPKCNHAFHIDCIDTWLLSHKNCPLCRAPILRTESPHQETETNPHHLQDSELSNDLSEERESSGSRNLLRVQSDLANHCGSGSAETMRRSFSIGGSSSLQAKDGDDDIVTRSRRRFYSSLSATANLFSSSRRSRKQDLSVLPIQTPSTS